MTRRPRIAVALLVLLLAGPFGLLELDHDRLHGHDGSAAEHAPCPVCFAAKTPISCGIPATPLPGIAPERIVPAPRADLPETAAILPSAAPRGPPAHS